MKLKYMYSVHEFEYAKTEKHEINILGASVTSRLDPDKFLLGVLWWTFLLYLYQSKK